MYGLRDIPKLEKLDNRHFKAKSGPNLVCIMRFCMDWLKLAKDSTIIYYFMQFNIKTTWIRLNVDEFYVALNVWISCRFKRFYIDWLELAMNLCN